MLIGFEPYRETWIGEFERAAMALRRVVGTTALRIDHIGSTAVPGLAAKPVIDMQMTLASLAHHRDLIPRIESAGYVYRPDINMDRPPPWEAGDPGEWTKAYFRTPDGIAPRYHLHVREQGRRNQRYALLMRDFLRASERTRLSYGRYKAQVADAVGHLSQGGGRGLYLDLKDPVFDMIADAAEQWAASVDWHPPPGDA